MLLFVKKGSWLAILTSIAFSICFYTNAVHAEGQLVVQANGVSIGISPSFGVFENSLPIVNALGSHFRISPIKGTIDARGVFYTKPNCEGKAYTTPFWGKFVFLGRETIYYIPEKSIVQKIVPQSTWSPFFNGCAELEGQKAKYVMEVFPNDSSITGVAHSSFELPITVHYESTTSINTAYNEIVQ